MNNKHPNNECGECRECCVELPINEPELVKPAGVRCHHLCAKGCDLHGTPEQPELCRDFRCVWRSDPWLGKRPEYRPDRLGVLFMEANDVMTLNECRPGALDQPQVKYIASRMRQPGRLTKWKRYGLAHGIDPSTAKHGQIRIPADRVEMEVGPAEDEVEVRFRLPMVA